MPFCIEVKACSTESPSQFGCTLSRMTLLSFRSVSSVTNHSGNDGRLIRSMNAHWHRICPHVTGIVAAEKWMHNSMFGMYGAIDVLQSGCKFAVYSQ